MYDVITFGSATIDTYVDTYDRKHLTDAQKKMRYNHEIIYHTGSKILIQEMNTSVGGGGTNTALTFSRFGLKTAYCGCLGEDSNAIIIKEFLSKENINFVGHATNDCSGYSVILDSVEHDRTILTYKGANNKLAFKKINTDSFSGTKVFYFSSLLEESFETQKKLISFAQKEGIKIAFNPSEYQACQGAKALQKVLEATDFLILNKEEAQDLCGSHTPHPKELLNKLKSCLPKKAIALFTDAKRGAYVFDGHTYLHISSKEVKVVETTGAGDAFASGFISGILKGETLEESLKLAMANSHSVITHKGAKEIILTYDEAKKRVKKEKYKVVSL